MESIAKDKVVLYQIKIYCKRMPNNNKLLQVDNKMHAIHGLIVKFTCNNRHTYRSYRLGYSIAIKLKYNVGVY